MLDHPQIQAVLSFWFGAPGSTIYNKTRAEWFRKSDAFDAEIRTRFGALIEEALAGRLEAWRAAVEGAVAEIIILDQFTRNAHRDTPRSFAGDARALSLARALVAAGQDRTLPGVWRQFVYLPFEHAEDLADQEQSLRLFRGLAHDDPTLADLVTWAERHHAIIARFGRFPHRNAILGRASTPDEEVFLRTLGSSF